MITTTTGPLSAPCLLSRPEATGFGKMVSGYTHPKIDLEQDYQPQFFIRGVTYNPRQRPQASGNRESSINPLSEAWLPELRKDIPFFHQPGINTVFLNHKDPAHSPESALQLLHDEGIYVLLELFTNVQPKGSHHLQAVTSTSSASTAPAKSAITSPW
jgi:hypothetical protein